MPKAILSVCMNPTFQKTLILNSYVPDTVNRVAQHRFDASGKGVNVCRVLTQLGKNCIHLCQLGGQLRPLFLELCAQDGLKIEWVESHSPIRFAYTVINKNEGSVTELVEEGEQVESKTEERLLKAYEKLLPDISTVIISGSMAAGFSNSLISEMVRRAKALSHRVILDIRGKDLLESLPWKPDIIKPNLYEFASTFAPDIVKGNEVIPDISFEPEIKKRITGICKDIFEKYECQIVLSRGTKAIWYAEKGEVLEYEVDPIKPVNTIGSGDAFSAGLAAALEDGGSLKEAIAEGVRCGKLNAGQLRPGVIR